ncbi:cell wall-binding repeat-containing protein [Pyrococcus abyssi]|uniref:Cell wall-binding repeat 2 family protein n=1 Tax=Pyrococcus abyssi (strain GE5 / Orsay) TaxID=272844 RepID=Q9V1C9_PYRAB|nr:cell wall-binding repeat-containing protein [Pyrococcus abyssi]CAB49420.1 Hypothetical protein, containing putative cell wall-binding domain [Pyrococcus abyssi GE5]CCE69887.1 TPA: hypothetical protein PAB0337 [Pyrococcus abyssi GE5]
MRSLLSILLISILVLSALPAQAQVKNVIILVSDNEADLTLAEKIGELIQAKVVVTPWGIYNESVSAEIAEKNPSLVLIIGGPKAVSPQYEEDFQSLGISYVRRWGETRVETAISVIKFLKKDYPWLFKNAKLALVYGWDLAGIHKVRELMKRENVIPIYLSRNSSSVPINWSGRFIVVETPFSAGIFKKIRIPNPIIVKANVTKEITWDAIERAEKAIIRAKRIIELTDIPQEKRLEIANRLLSKAKEAYSTGDYIRAYNLANAARSIADSIVSMGMFSKPRIRLPMKLQIQMQLRLLKMLTMRLESQGIDVKPVKELIAKAEDALKRGDLNEAMKYLNEAKELIRQIHRGRVGWRGKGKP